MALQFQQEWQRIQSLCRRAEPKLRSRMTFASGALLSGALFLRFMPLPGINSSAQLEPLQENLWMSTGIVRQSVVDLYRVQRTRQQAADGTAVSTEDSNSGEVVNSNAAADTSTGNSAAPAPANLASEEASGVEASAATAQEQVTPPEATSVPEAAPPPAPAAAVPVDQNVIDNVLEMRVAIARDVPTLAVGTDTLGWVINTDGSAHCDIPPQSSLTATPTSQGIDFSGCQLSGAVWLEAEQGGYVFVNDSWYQGRVLLFNDGGELLAVNFVMLGQYLSSVVGSEMYHHWPLESLKAQAVAARSYALTHHVIPASDYFDLDNTQRFQAYKGIAMETTNTQRAVAETAGEFISYEGGIVESLYAASDQIVQEAHGGKGMSQHGAKDYALQGYQYDQILGVYYPGTSLARLVVE
ncbi:MAG: SpoIID/LytB domain-containing protein [Cyanobacteria bacterium J06626_18]